VDHIFAHNKLLNPRWNYFAYVRKCAMVCARCITQSSAHILYQVNKTWSERIVCYPARTVLSILTSIYVCICSCVRAACDSREKLIADNQQHSLFGNNSNRELLIQGSVNSICVWCVLFSCQVCLIYALLCRGISPPRQISMRILFSGERALCQHLYLR
jgi:hypothetical protein